MKYRYDDEIALCSIGILAEAVERICVKGVLELRLLRNALREAVAHPSDETVKTAFGMFARVDRDYRRLIAHEALTLAAQQKGRYAPKPRALRAPGQAGRRGAGASRGGWGGARARADDDI